VSPLVQKPADVTIATKLLQGALRLSSSLKVGKSMHKAGTLLLPLSATFKTLRGQLPDREIVEVPTSDIRSTESSLKETKARKATFVYEQPDLASARKMELPPFSDIKVIG
jgi:hypothetical protein